MPPSLRVVARQSRDGGSALPLSLRDIPLKEGDKRKMHHGRIFMYYDHGNGRLARALRKEMTPWERKLWYCFLREYPVRFQRQKPIERYIVDFWCAKASLIVELDGSGHFTPETIKKDEIRTKELESFGYKVIRFTNSEVDKNFYEVCSVIDREIKERLLLTTSKG